MVLWYTVIVVCNVDVLFDVVKPISGHQGLEIRKLERTVKFPRSHVPVEVESWQVYRRSEYQHPKPRCDLVHSEVSNSPERGWPLLGL